MKRTLLSSVLACICLSPAAQHFSLIKDINPGSSTSNICYLTNVNDKLFFAANDGANGMELWKSDGTDAGTNLVKDINPGISNSSIGYLTKVGHVVFFVASNGTSGAEIWKSDGTAEGTVLVKDVNTSGPSYPTYLANVQDALYFCSNDGNSGMELWMTDGTSSGTVLVKDIWPGSDGSYPSNIVNVNGQVYFCAANGVDGAELWKSDGSNSGTQMVRDIFPGSESSYPGSLKNVDGRLFFTADDGVAGTELWKSDGTISGTSLVKDIWPGAESGAAGNFSTLINDLIFTGNDGLNGYKTWQSDGSALGTKIATGFVDPGEGELQELVETNLNIFASIGQSNTGLELWGITYSGTLPVTFLNFSGKLIEDDGVLNWTTTNEFFTKDFIVQRSTDGLVYEVIGDVACVNGKHSYQYVDREINKSTASTFYYRLKQNDISQRFKYSKIVTLTKDEQKKSFVYLSPTTNELNVSLYNSRETRLEYSLNDNAGRILRKGFSKLQIGSNVLTFSVSDFSAGIYYLKLINNSFKQTHRFVKK